MKFKFAITAITTLLIVLFIKNAIETGSFDIIKFIGIIAITLLLLWIEHKLERPVNRESLKRVIKKEFDQNK